MKRMGSLFFFNTLFQFRQGIHPLYMILTGIYIAVLLSLPQSIREQTAPLLIFSEPSILGLFFIGGILFFEKEQGTLTMLAVTPAKTGEYLTAVSLNLALISLILSAAIALAGTPISWRSIYFIPAVLLTSLFFTALGIILTSRIRSVSSYLMISGLANIPFILPLLDHFRILKSDLFFLIPTMGTITLIRCGTGADEPIYRIVLSFVTLLTGTVLVGTGAIRAMKRFIFQKEESR